MVPNAFRQAAACSAVYVLPILVLPGSARAAIVNLTNELIAGHPQSTMMAGSTSFVGGMLNGALYRRPISADDSNAGSGVFRDLYRIDEKDPTTTNPAEGYNRDGAMDGVVPNGFDPVIRISDLVEDSTGTSYVFLIDTNEPGNNPEKFISLDDLRIYVAATTDPAPLPQSVTELGAELGLPAYEMNTSGQENHVLLDYSLFSGSGQMDIFIFVPKTAFDGSAADDLVYIYTKFGTYLGSPGFDGAAGSEQVSMPGKSVSGLVDPLLSAVPEPSISTLALVAGCLVMRRRRRD